LAALTYRHPTVQRLRRLVGRRSARQVERAFVAEGAKVVGEALTGRVAVEAIFVAPGASPADLVVVERAAAAGAAVHEMEKGVLERVAGTVSPQAVLAVVAALDVALDALARDGVIVVCDEVRDPGNLGTLLRSAEGAGARGVVCADGTVDPYNPKCVRASAGALFHVPLVVGGNTVEVLSDLGAWGLRRLGTSARATDSMWDVDLSGPIALVLGNEAAGLGAEVDGVVDGWVAVPIQGRSESLNAGMAGTVLVYEAARQRRAAGGGR